jgi:phage-related protein (TIGR01555 family)
MGNFISRIFGRREQQQLMADDGATAVLVNPDRQDTRPLAHMSTPPGAPGVFNANDALTNLVTGMGTWRDKTTHSKYMPELGIDRMTADAIFGSSWIAKRVVTTIADDMCRKWRTVMWDGSNDEDGIFDINKEERRVKVRKRVHSALKWSRHYGGSIVVMMVRGQERNLEEPLDVERIRKGDLLSLLVYDRWRVYGMPPDKTGVSNPSLLVPYLNQQLDDPNFGLPEYYYLADSSKRIHHSRCVRFDGEELPWSEWTRNAMWHDSVYKSIMTAVKGYGSLFAGCLSLVSEASLDVLMAEGLVERLADDQGTDEVRKRYQLLAMMKSVVHMVVIDKDRESFDRKPATFTGLKDLLDRFASDVAGAADIPLTRLFGQSPGGLGSNGDGEQGNYDAHIAAKQESDLSPQMEQIDQVVVRSALGYMPDDYRSEWNPLREMSEEDLADIQLKNAQRDKIYWDMGCLAEGAIARELRANGTYPNLTKDDVDLAEGLSKAGEGESGDERNPNDKTKGWQEGAAGSTALALTPTMQGSIVTVNQALATLGLPAWPDADGNLTIAEFQAKHSAPIAAAANASAGKTGEQSTSAVSPPEQLQRPPVKIEAEEDEEDADAEESPTE